MKLDEDGGDDFIRPNFWKPFDNDDEDEGEEE